ncbi:Hypothetical predicted protein [Paramuricea clavata]|uniref:Uncharacterized protein n=1 Tax=Paramuricea clavata TaxID=317549 RepID=A0A6S7G006_PARCT|nr:Hypothetical predicted protein [Paramuricea clavata]
MHNLECEPIIIDTGDSEVFQKPITTDIGESEEEQEFIPIEVVPLIDEEKLDLLCLRTEGGKLFHTFTPILEKDLARTFSLEEDRNSIEKERFINSVPRYDENKLSGDENLLASFCPIVAK